MYEKRLELKSFMLKSVLVPLDYAALLPDAAAGAGAVCKVEFYASNIESGADVPTDSASWSFDNCTLRKGLNVELLCFG